MSTYAEIITNGYAKSSAARVDTMASPAELIVQINNDLRAWWQVMSREVPYILGTSTQMAFNGTGWSRPTNCVRAIKVLADGGTQATPAIASGTELAIVPYDDQLFCEGTPSLTELGQQYIPVGQSIDPTGGTLTLVFARAPQLGTATADSIDSLFPSFFDDFLNFGVAGYLAMKDERSEDEQAFLSMKSVLLQQSVDWAQEQTYSLQQRFPVTTPPMANTDGGRQTSSRAQR